MHNDRLLISSEDFYEYETISANTDPVTIMPYVKQAQKFDLVSVINKELIEDLQDNPETGANQALIPLVRPVLAYYSFARYIMQRAASDTPFGFVTKTNEFSQPVSEKTITRMATEARSLAAAYATEVLDYLKENKSDYPLWKTECSNRKPNSFPRITPVSIR